MKIKGFIKLGVTLSLMYLTLGDTVLPQAYGNKSQEIRGDINRYLISLFPDNELETLKRRQFTMESLERGNLASPSSNL